ncbi:MAG TPA: tetratricopeptide repeat protein, partial [Burkholderiaceae bacterium]|nr:tetratricopeptide repeat protein [Burkholderiaceae bacterium]
MRAQPVAPELQRAVQLHQAGRLAEAEPLYVRWLRANPGEVSGTYFLAGLRLQQGRAAEAATLLRQALQRDPGH